MFRYGKLARQAVSAISYLAENYQPENNRFISSSEVGKNRNIPTALAAKLLSLLASQSLLQGVTGPGGGYRLARPPEQISLADIVRLFEQPGGEAPCPFGKGWCGKGDPCPLHEQFVELDEIANNFLLSNTLEVFIKPNDGTLPINL